ncbi:MAG: aminoacyl-tRNA hydrolase [Planctomycetes bacterium]|nr:aminoacyl-tRNA hydrolase [Planctomycetota bacterium]
MLIIIGLGNPGKKYELTRHNVGFMVIDKLACSEWYAGITKTFRLKEEYRSLVSKGTVSNEKVLLVKPQTYMNNSGTAAAVIAQNFSEPIDGLLVVLDDYNLPIGTVRFRREGSSGGHKGLQSIIGQLGDNKFHRLRVGIGLPDGVDPMNFVLDKFTVTEEKEIKQALNSAVEAIVFYIQNGIEKSMNKYN